MHAYIRLPGIQRSRNSTPSAHLWHDWPRYERQPYFSRPVKSVAEPEGTRAVVSAPLARSGPRLAGQFLSRVLVISAMIAGASPALCQNEGEGFLFGSPNLSKDQLQWLVGRMIQRQEVQTLGGLGAGQSGLQNDIAANVQKMGADAVAGLKAAATFGRSALPGTGPAPTGGGTSPSTTPSGEQAAASSSPAPAPASGATQAPDIKFTAVDGRVVDLASLRGKVVLIDFWATWCKPCMGEIPNVVAAYQKYHDQGFEVIGISFDTNKVTLQRVTEDMHMPWPQYFDGKGWQNDFGVKFGIHGIPTMWLIDQQGRLVTKNARTDLAGQVAKLLSTGTK